MSPLAARLLCVPLSMTMSMVGVVASQPAMAGVIAAAMAEPTSSAELMEQAEAQRAQGAFLASARSFVAAYDALSAEEQLGLMGEITINNAADLFRVAQQQDPKNLALLQEEATVLQRFLQARGRAHPSTPLEDAVPPELIEERDRVDAEIERLQRAQESAEAARGEPADAPVSDGAEDGLPDAGAEPGNDRDAPRKGSFYFGREHPTPRWQWAGLGVSLGIFAAAGAGALGTGLWLTIEQGGFRKELLERARSSLTDQDDLNDVPPDLPPSINLCDYSREPPTDESGEPVGSAGDVRNADIVALCDRADTVRRTQIGLVATMGAAFVSTLVFSGLLLIHRRPEAERSAGRRRALRADLVPGRDGVMLHLGGRF